MINFDWPACAPAELMIKIKLLAGASAEAKDGCAARAGLRRPRAS
jgi:hypothetical protein